MVQHSFRSWREWSLADGCRPLPGVFPWCSTRRKLHGPLRRKPNRQFPRNDCVWLCIPVIGIRTDHNQFPGCVQFVKFAVFRCSPWLCVGVGELACQSGVWAKQVKIAPNTQTLGWSEAQFVPTTRYCPAGYTAVSSVAYSAPSGRGVCQTTIFNYTSGTGSQYAGNCGYYPGDSSFSHYLTCMKF